MAADQSPTGILSLAPTDEVSFVAMKVELPDSIPIAGIRWYNNDGSTLYPVVLLAAATGNGEPDLSTTLILGSDVAGNHLGWSDLTAGAPVLNDVGVLFVVFQLPAFDAIAHAGAGPGLGYWIDDQGTATYMSPDGELWIPVGGNVHVAYETIPATSKTGAESILFQRQEIPVFVTALGPPSPNPFNPSTKLAFTLAKAGQTKLIVYNARGQLVRTLVSDFLQSGAHEAVWLGKNDEGAQVASGVYIAMLASADVTLNQRLVLLK